MCEKLIECIHIDLYEIHFKPHLNHLISIDSGELHERFLAEQAVIKLECEKVTQYYGSLSRAQKLHFDSLLNRTFKSPTHSIDGEKELLQKYLNDNAIKSILLTQMAFFQSSQASKVLEKAKNCLLEFSKAPSFFTSHVYINHSEACLVFRNSDYNIKYAALYGKKYVGNAGLTTANTSLTGTEIKQDKM
jgi:hypothetical protein